LDEPSYLEICEQVSLVGRQVGGWLKKLQGGPPRARKNAVASSPPGG
jgi:hypothetical protein